RKNCEMNDFMQQNREVKNCESHDHSQRDPDPWIRKIDSSGCRQDKNQQLPCDDQEMPARPQLVQLAKLSVVEVGQQFPLQLSSMFWIISRHKALIIRIWPRKSKARLGDAFLRLV